MERQTTSKAQGSGDGMDEMLRDRPHSAIVAKQGPPVGIMMPARFSGRKLSAQPNDAKAGQSVVENELVNALGDLNHRLEDKENMDELKRAVKIATERYITYQSELERTRRELRSEKETAATKIKDLESYYKEELAKLQEKKAQQTSRQAKSSEQKIKELGMDLKKMSEKAKAAEDRLESAVQKNKSLTQRIEALNSRHAASESAVADLSKEKLTLLDAKDCLAHTLKSTKQSEKDAKERADNCEAELERVHAELSRANVELEEANKLLDKRQDSQLQAKALSVSPHSDHPSQACQTPEWPREETRASEEEREDGEKRMVALQGENMGLKNRVIELVNAIEASRACSAEEISSLQDELMGLQSKADKHEKEVDSLTTKCAVLEGAIASKDAMLRKANERYDARDKENKKLVICLRESKAALLSSREAIRQVGSGQSEASAEVVEISRALQAFQADMLAGLEEEQSCTAVVLGDAVGGVREIIKEFLDLRRGFLDEIGLLQTRVKSKLVVWKARQAHEKTVQDEALQASQNYVEELEEGLQRERQGKERADSDAKKTISKLESQLRDISNQLSQAREEYVSQEVVFKKSIKTLENKLAAKMKENARMERNLKIKESEYGKANVSNAVLLRDSKALEEKLAQRDEHIATLTKEAHVLQSSLRLKQAKLEEQIAATKNVTDQSARERSEMLKALEDSRQGVGLQESKLRKLESARLRERQSERERTKLMEGENSRLEKEVEHLKERLASATAAAKAATREKDRLVTQDSELRERLRCAERQLGAAEKAVENEKSFVNSEKLDKKRWKEEAGTLRQQLQQAQGELAAAIQTRVDEENGLRQEHKAMKDLEKRLKKSAKKLEARTASAEAESTKAIQILYETQCTVHETIALAHDNSSKAVGAASQLEYICTSLDSVIVDTESLVQFASTAIAQAREHLELSMEGCRRSTVEQLAQMKALCQEFISGWRSSFHKVEAWCQSRREETVRCIVHYRKAAEEANQRSLGFQEQCSHATAKMREFEIEQHEQAQKQQTQLEGLKVAEYKAMAAISSGCQRISAVIEKTEERCISSLDDMDYRLDCAKRSLADCRENFAMARVLHSTRESAENLAELLNSNIAGYRSAPPLRRTYGVSRISSRAIQSIQAKQKSSMTKKGGADREQQRSPHAEAKPRVM